MKARCQRWSGRLGTALLVCLAIATCLPDDGDRREVRQATLDLKDYNFNSAGPVRLDGGWEFYWNRLLSPQDFLPGGKQPRFDLYIKVPDVWNGRHLHGKILKGTGFATYRMWIDLPPGKDKLAVYVPDQESAFLLYANGEVLAGNGKVANNAKNFRGQYRPGMYRLNVRQGRLELILQIASFQHRSGGLIKSIYLGNDAQIQKAVIQRYAVHFFLIGGLMMIGLYHISLFYMRPGGRGSLYFGLICLFAVLRVLLRGERILVQLWPELDWNFLLRLEYVNIYALLPVSVAFVANTYRRVINIYIIRFIYLFSVLLIISAAVLPVRISSHLISPFQLVLLAAVIYGMIVLMIAAMRRYAGAAILLVGLSAILLAGIVDIIIVRKHLQMMELLPFAVFLFAISQAVRISVRFLRRLQSSQELSLHLEDMVHKRTEQLENERKAMQESSRQVEKVRDALWGEMQVAYKIQTMLLPRNPMIKGYEVLGSMMPARQVGGDYYDVIKTNGQIWLVIGDVAGHGIPAGLIMMMARTTLRSLIQSQPDWDVDQMLAQANRLLFADIQKVSQSRYMTLSLLRMDPGGRIRFSGLHLDMLIHRHADDSLDRIPTNGMWLGVLEEIDEYLEVGHFQLESGDTLLLYTDGFIESFTEEGEMYGQDRLEELFMHNSRNSLTELHQNLIADLVDYRCKDDITLLLIRRDS